eukprot:823104-Pelagomonas_calceolata.AAC.3
MSLLQIKKEQNTQAVKTILTPIKEKKVHRAEAPPVPSNKRRKREVNEVLEITSSTLCLTLLMRVKRSLLMSVSGACKFVVPACLHVLLQLSCPAGRNSYVSLSSTSLASL